MIHNKQHSSFFSILASLLILLLSVSIHAGQPLVWEMRSRAELLKRDARGVSISDTGVLKLAPKLTEVFNTQQTYIWSSAVGNQGDVFLGTGHDGRIYRVGAGG